MTCREEEIISSADIARAKKILNNMATKIGELLSVVRVTSPFGLSVTKCYDLNVPTSIKLPNTVSNADIIIISSFRPNQVIGVIASAGPCEITLGLERPVGGIINMDPAYIKTKYFTDETYTSVLMHEMIHALGFTSSFYTRWKNSNGNYYAQPTDTITRTHLGSSRSYVRLFDLKIIFF
jgi:hypothetical protein